MQKNDLLAPENLSHLKSVVNFCRHLPNNATAEVTIKTFFLAALLPFFSDSEGGGLDIRMGHFLYRLSEFLGEERRKSFEVYPSWSNNEGSLIIDGQRWHSLEDWRKMWERKNGDYPIPVIDLTKRFFLTEQKTD